MKSLTGSPNNYIISYEDFNELMDDYMTVTGQLEFIKSYTDKVDYEISINIGVDSYFLNVSVWKT